jgi:hypothetical protein
MRIIELRQTFMDSECRGNRRGNNTRAIRAKLRAERTPFRKKLAVKVNDDVQKLRFELALHIDKLDAENLVGGSVEVDFMTMPERALHFDRVAIASESQKQIDFLPDLEIRDFFIVTNAATASADIKKFASHFYDRRGWIQKFNVRFKMRWNSHTKIISSLQNINFLIGVERTGARLTEFHSRAHKIFFTTDKKTQN